MTNKNEESGDEADKRGGRDEEETKKKKDGADKEDKQNQDFCFERDKGKEPKEKNNHKKACSPKQQSLSIKKSKRHEEENEEDKENKKVSYINCAMFKTVLRIRCTFQLDS